MSIGIVLYYLLWPLVWFYSPLTLRVRVIIKHEENILVVKNWFGSGHLQLPGGGKKAGETPIETAVREIKEELNINLSSDNMKQVSTEAVVHNEFGLLKRNHFVFVELTSKPEVVHSKEIIAHQWIKLSNFKFPQQIERQL